VKFSLFLLLSHQGFFLSFQRAFRNLRSSLTSNALFINLVKSFKFTLKYTILSLLHVSVFNPLKPNDHYSGRTAPLTSKRCILYIYSTNIGTEYFKHGLYSPFFSSSKCSLFHNSNIFGACIIHISCTECAKIKKKIIPAPKV